MKTHSSLSILFLAFLLTLQSHAQLALIREGRESVGVMDEDEWFGAAVALGDFDGDGYKDLATGAPFQKSGGNVFLSGSVIINRGSIYGITWEGAYALSPIDGSLDPAAQLQMGKALAVGNFNGDAYEDLAVGLPAATVSGQSAAGRVFVYYGGPGGLPGVADTIHEGQLGAAVESGDLFGDALAAGRLGDDPFDDLVVAATGENSGRGAIIVIRGSAAGLDLSKREILLGSDMGFANQPGDRFGQAIKIGNVFGFAGAELIVGAPFAELTPSAPSSGLVYIAPTTDARIDTANASTISPITVGDALFTQGNMGMSLEVGDFWGDGAPFDLAIGAPGAHSGGRVYIGRGTLFGLTYPTTLEQPAGWGADDADDDFGRAVAAGDHDGDGDDELAVGCPGQDIFLSFTQNSGSVHIFEGKETGPSQVGATSYTDLDLGDEMTGEGRLGYALASGRTSASQRKSFVAGAPQKFGNTGQVFDIAPWRQIPRPLCRSALAADCEGNIVYALRPFETIKLASTTKIMTVLLACEATARPLGDPLRVGLNESYTIEDWMYDGFPLTSGCSIFGYTPLPTNVFTESFTFEELIRTTVMVSGNDSAFAVADAMTGEISTWQGIDMSAPQFAQLMNDRAAAIGMNDTNYTNPAGVAPNEPTSTAYDQWLLAQEAMQNPLFRDMVGTTSFPMQKTLAVGEAGNFQTANVNVGYSWLTGMKCLEPKIVGIKDGSTPGAKHTRVAAAQFGSSPTKLAYGMGFRWAGTTDNPCDPGEIVSIGSLRTAQLVKLGLSFCNTDVGGPGGVTTPPPPPTHEWTVNDGTIDALQFGSFGAESEEPAAGPFADLRPTKFRLYPRGRIETRQSFSMQWKYRGLWEIEPGETVGLRASPVLAATATIRVLAERLPADDASLRVASTSTGGSPLTLLLPAEQDYTLDKWTGTEGEWSIELFNGGRDSIVVAFAGQFTLRPTFHGTPGEFFEACLEPVGISLRDNHTLCELEPVPGDPSFDIWIELTPAESRRWAPPLRISRIDIRASTTRERLGVELQFGAAAPYGDLPLDAFYKEFSVETSPAMRAGTWMRIVSIPAGAAGSDEWQGEIDAAAAGFLQLRGIQGERSGD